MHKLPDVIVTHRTRLRPFEFRDVDDVFAYASDPEWLRYLPLPRPYTIEVARQFIATQTLQNRALHPSWAIELGDTVIGGINMRFLFDYRIGEIGYSVARKYWGQGIATEVARAVVDQAFTKVHELHRVRAMADARNVGSQRVMEKIGMKREGVLRQNRYVSGAFVDEVWYGVLRSEWRG